MVDQEKKLKARLIHVIEQERAVYKRLCELSREKTTILVENNSPALKEIIQRINAAIAQVDDLEDNRKQILARVSVITNIPISEITLSSLSLLWDEPYLEQLKKELQEMFSALSGTNERNQILIQQAQDVFSFMRNLLYSAADPGTGYNSQGQIKQPKGGYFEEEA